MSVCVCACVCVYESACVPVSAGICGVQKRVLEWKLPVSVSCPVWASGSELKSSCS